jgi:uncharacterized membrane protein YdbT with pleckstrin-like domain
MEPTTNEKPVFKGNPSAVTFLGTFLFCLILIAAMMVGLGFFWNRFTDDRMRLGAFALVLIPVGFILVKWLLLKTTVYEITSERIKIRTGLLSKRTDELELYRVKDTSLIEPFLFRMFSVGNISIVTADTSTPTLNLVGVKNASQVREELRKSVEACRTSKGTRMMEME